MCILRAQNEQADALAKAAVKKQVQVITEDTDDFVY
jgi:hypothetical protein